MVDRNLGKVRADFLCSHFSFYDISIFKIMLKEYASHVMFREWIINGFDSYKGPLCVFIINGRNCFAPKYDTLLLGGLSSSFTQLLILDSNRPQ